MDTENGKPIRVIETYGKRPKVTTPYYGRVTVSMTFEELEALWRKVKLDGRLNKGD